MIKKEDLIRIGQINKPHGIQGELSCTFFLEAFQEEEVPSFFICEIEGIYVPFFVASYRVRSTTSALIRFEDIDTIEEAREFTNLDLYVERNALPDTFDEIPADSFLGYRVEDAHHGDLGEIVGLDDSTENALFVIEKEGAELLIPVADEFVLEIDDTDKILRVDLPQGLLEIND